MRAFFRGMHLAIAGLHDDVNMGWSERGYRGLALGLLMGVFRFPIKAYLSLASPLHSPPAALY